jgi:hypothetical protein
MFFLQALLAKLGISHAAKLKLVYVLIVVALAGLGLLGYGLSGMLAHPIGAKYDSFVIRGLALMVIGALLANAFYGVYKQEARK